MYIFLLSVLYPNYMCCVFLYTSESLDELTEMVVPHFHGVENKKVTIPHWEEHPFGPAQLQNMCYVTPVKDIRNLSVSWSIPDLQPYYKTNVSVGVT
jgi:insulysin